VTSYDDVKAVIGGLQEKAGPDAELRQLLAEAAERKVA
jgi:hypothetical protein